MVFVGLACLLIAGAWIAYGRQAEVSPPATGPGRQSARPVPVIVSPVRTGDLNVYLTALGTVTPLNTVTVKSRVDGKLMTTHFTEGHVVHAGAICSPRSTRGRSRPSSSRPRGSSRAIRPTSPTPGSTWSAIGD